jgi:FixJ family two-component response regulator
MASRPLVAIVEDDDVLRGALDQLLRSCGYRTSGHACAEHFLASAALGTAACVITDIQMPGMDGIDLKLRIDRVAPGTPVILVTARAEDHVLVRARASAPWCLLRKPFEPDALVECVERALEHTS